MSSTWSPNASADGKPQACGSCKTGALLSFRWDSASLGPFELPDRSVFARPAELRYGTLYECIACGQPWYLHGNPSFMHVVPRDRMDLIRRWNEQPVTFSREHLRALEAIGATPQSPGSPKGITETPCAVATSTGERFETAIVSVQLHAPFESWRVCRLATDIADIQPSPFALPLRVRAATAKAKEVSMNFAPTIVELPDGRRWTLNGRQSFFVQNGAAASDLVLRSWWRSAPEPRPPIYDGYEAVTYFVA